MKDISDYLVKFKNIKNPKQDKEIIAEAIKKVTSHSIDTSAISIQRTIIFLKTNPYLLLEIRMKKETLLEEIKKNLKEITDIK